MADVKSFSVLYVEDEDNLRETMVDEFTDLGLEVSSASNATDALKILKEKDIDVVISDIKMPDIDGIELRKMATAILKKQPRIWLGFTAYSDTNLEDFRKLGFDEVFYKPFKPIMLVNYARKMLQEKKVG